MGQVKFIQGDTINATIVIRDEDKALVNLTGGTVEFRIVEDVDTTLEADALFTSTFGVDLTLTDATNGEATLVVARSVSKLWTPGAYRWELEYVDSGTNYSHTDSDSLIVKKSIYSADA